MTENRNGSSDYVNGSDFFDQFPDDEKENLKEVWQKSATSHEDYPTIGTNETEDALKSVHLCIENHKASSTGKPSSALRIFLAAAVVLIIAGASYLLVPVSYNAPYGEIITAELPDGSVVDLNSGTHLQHNRLFSITNRNITMNGEAFFNINKADEPFIIHANGSVIEVTGTRFNMRSWSDEPKAETVVSVEEGRVRFFSEKEPQQQVEMNAGTLSRWNTEMDKPANPEPAETADITGWRNNMLIFNEQSLSLIFRELERRFDIHIQFDNKIGEMDILTAYYSPPLKPDSIIEDICTVKDLKYSRTANGYRIYK